MSDETLAPQGSMIEALLLGPVGIAASLISMIIVLILSYEPVEFLSQVVLFVLFVALVLFVGSHQLLFDLSCRAFLEACPEEKRRVAINSLHIRVADAVYLIALFVWKAAIAILFFVSNLGYLAVVSIIVVAVDLLLFYQSWKRETRRFSYT